VFGPVFLEFIRRKGDKDFGEGHFRALFESIEEDQIRRGVLKPGEAAAWSRCRVATVRLPAPKDGGLRFRQSALPIATVDHGA
jgi:hypothetical protein